MGGSVSTSTTTTPRTPLPAMETSAPLRPPKLLLNVTVYNSGGAIQVLMLPEDTVGDLIKTALEIYNKEKRRPLLKDTDPTCYHLLYSPYNLQSLKPDKKLKNLGSRNFFLCSKSRTSSH